MERVELERRIEASGIKIGKIEKRIAKWELANSEKGFIKDANGYYYGMSYEEYKERYFDDYLRDCEREIKYANQDLTDAKNTLAKYIIALEEKDNYEAEEKIQVIVEFLERWKANAKNWYIENGNLLMELRAHQNEEFDKWKLETGYKSFYNFSQEYYSTINGLTKELVSGNKMDVGRLETYLNKEVEAKYKDLVLRVTKVVGLIEDASGLTIGNQGGEINGIVKGQKGVCEVRTISAGGYNIQCFHYRVLINRLS